MKNILSTTTAADHCDALEKILEGGKPFAVLKKQHEPFVRILEGEVHSYHHLSDIPRFDSPEQQHRSDIDVFSAVPYAQLREKGADVNDPTPIRSLVVTAETRVAVNDILHLLPELSIELSDELQYRPDDIEYARRVQSVKENLIGKGAGSSFTLSRKAETTIREYSVAKLLSIFRSILQNEYGTYLNFAFYDGESSLIGASPERHLTVENGSVKMNPISGTLRKFPVPVTKQRLIEFLRNEKEVMELFMVLDEELKQMAQICDRGGIIVGPSLKEMSKLFHTEYTLTGHSDGDPFDLFRTSMFAPTVTSSPTSSGPAATAEYEDEPRRYYSGALLMTGTDPDGKPILDSAIGIRMAEIDSEGVVTLQSGATIVRDSDPQEEMMETRGKLSGMLNAIRGGGTTSSPLLAMIMDKEVQSILRERNSKLSQYHFEDQEKIDHTIDALKGRSVTIVDNGDDFCHMLKHMIRGMGADVQVLSFLDFDTDADSSDIVVVGPGPGDPTNTSDSKMQKVAHITDHLLSSGRKFLSVCLGHQLLCRALGMPIGRKQVPMQGVQKEIDLFGTVENVGFYNTYAAGSIPIENIEQSVDRESGDVHALRGERFTSFQFHPESVLSQNGFKILGETLSSLIKD